MRLSTIKSVIVEESDITAFSDHLDRERGGHLVMQINKFFLQVKSFSVLFPKVVEV